MVLPAIMTAAIRMDNQPIGRVLGRNVKRLFFQLTSRLAGARAKELTQKMLCGSAETGRAPLIAQFSANGQVQPRAGRSAADLLLPVRAARGMPEPIACTG